MKAFLLVLAVAAVVAVLAWYFNPYRRVVQRLKKSPISRIREVGEGQLVRIVGKIEASGPLLAAPLSGRACAAWHVVVEQRRKSGRSRNRRWSTILDVSDLSEMLVRDETGVAIVKPTAPKLAIVKDAHRSSSTFDRPTPELQAFLAAHGKLSENLFGLEKTLRYQEGVLEPGETIAVLARGTWETDAGPGEGVGYREAPRRLLMHAPDGPGTMHLSDDPDALG